MNHSLAAAPFIDPTATHKSKGGSNAWIFSPSAPLLYEHAVWPNPRRDWMPRGRIVPQIALNVDITPTILDLAGLPAPDSMQDRRLLSLTHGEVSADWRQDFFYEHLVPRPEKNGGYFIPSTEGVVDTTEKYMEYFLGMEQNGEPTFVETYDLEANPAGIDNLGLGDRADRLRKRLGFLRLAAE